MNRCRVWLVVATCLTADGFLHAADEPVFEDDVHPILRAHCFSCHGEAEELAGKLDLRQVQRMRRGGESGAAVVAGSRNASPVFQRVAAGEMPPEGKPRLSPAQIELLGRWIDAGATTREPETPDAAPSWITPADRAFWSFQPLRRPSAPTVNHATWSSGPVDDFVLHRLESQGLSPASPADPRTLLRRLSQTLIGLPPAPADVVEFAADPSPARYVAAVDRLLASPQFGERWGRAWLDLARYVDETPNYLNSAERAWLYRDWVIRSLNEDRPYDDFVRQQLAADHLPQENPENFAALGFLGLSPTYWKELQLSPAVIETIVADEWDERIDAVTRTFLGLTVSCARCHNHKFDPVTIEDYYALAGVMASTKLADRPLLPEPAAGAVRQARAQVAQWERQIQQLSKETSALAPILEAQIRRLREATPHYDEPWAHVVEDAALAVLPDGAARTRLEYRPGMAQDLPVFRRGNPADRGSLVPRRFLEVLSTPATAHFARGSGRAELAESVLHEAGPLAARVIVNRVWAQVFGRGLVATTSDFGRQGDRPTHPELLEYLAHRLIEHHWQLKPVLREMVLSAAFQQASQSDATSHERDPDARWLSRYPRRRLDVELWRDALLSAAGTLDDRMYGRAQPLNDTAFARRTLYGTVVREELDTLLRLFDFPEASVHSPGREPTTTPLQQLFVLNGSLVQTWSRTFAESLLQEADNDAARIESAYRRLLQRPPTADEQRLGLEFVATVAGDQPTRLELWTAYAQVLLGLNEVLSLE
ncbi:MAG: PSD1 and planctomycete cytochrome C domain-containing protein [Planctomycetaceae bacterium]|nr:PSD1 and planctomycete cytochrome C domain-containing protein [Planctomycetaceae bacterium]